MGVYTYNEDIEYTISSRRIVFEKEMKRLKSLMYGGFVHIWPYMTDDTGDYSEEQTIDFVNQIAEGAYGRRKHFSNILSEDRISFYKNILYCVLRTMTSGYTEYQSGNIAGFDDTENITFSNVISGFEDPSGELLDNNTVYFMKVLYKIFTQQNINLDVLHLLPEETEITEELLKEIYEEADARMAMEDALAEEYGWNMDEIRAEDQTELDQVKMWKVQEEERIQASFPEREHFCRSLEEICSYLRSHKMESFCLQSDIKELLFRFLSNQDLTVFDKEEDFIKVMVQLKKTIRTAQMFAED